MYVFDFLNLCPSPHLAAIGSVNISTVDADPNFGFQNPALVNDSMHHRVGLSYVNYLSDIGYGYATYSRKVEKWATNFHGGIHYVNYGSFDRADAFGVRDGTFTAGDMAMVVGASRAFDKFRYGANLKFIYSSLDSYYSAAAALDLGGTWYHPEQQLCISAVAKNIGYQFKTYTPAGTRSPLPFELQVGISKKLEHLPLRLSLTGIHLDKPKLVYTDPEADVETDLNGDPVPVKKNTVDKVFRHVVIGGEFLVGKAGALRFGYNHMRRSELKTAGRGGFSGFSVGVGIHVKRFSFDYAYSGYHVIGGSHAIGLVVGLGK